MVHAERRPASFALRKNIAIRRQERRRTNLAVRAEGWHREKKEKA